MVVLLRRCITKIFEMIELSFAINECKSEGGNVVVSLVALAINATLLVSILLSLVYLFHLFHFRF